MEINKEALDEIFRYSSSFRPFTRETLSISKAYYKNDLCLVLGAGVSVASNIPQWDELVSTLMIHALQEKLENGRNLPLEQLRHLSEITLDKNQSPLIQMRFIKTILEIEDSNFVNIVHSALYKNEIVYNTELVNSICALCDGKYGARVKRIITYNFDNIIEQYLKQKYIRHNVISSDKDIAKSGELNIYHVHGYIPLDNSEPSSSIVFSEEDYHKIYNNVYHWSNIAQLNSFRENTCLFIGCSLNDPNIRRLLDASIKKQHYAILARKKDYSKLGDSIDKSVVEEYIKLYEKKIEEYYSSIGIKVIWVNNFSEIDDVLEAIGVNIMFNEDLLHYVD